MCHLLYLMFRCDFDAMESLEKWEESEHSHRDLEQGHARWYKLGLLVLGDCLEHMACACRAAGGLQRAREASERRRDSKMGSE